MSRKIVESGLVRKLELPDPHLYLQAPGGQCLRLVGIEEDLSFYEGAGARPNVAKVKEAINEMTKEGVPPFFKSTFDPSLSFASFSPSWTISGVRSIPVTDRTRGANASATNPHPEATSRTESHMVGLASSTMGWIFSMARFVP